MLVAFLGEKRSLPKTKKEIVAKEEEKQTASSETFEKEKNRHLILLSDGNQSVDGKQNQKKRSRQDFFASIVDRA